MAWQLQGRCIVVFDEVTDWCRHAVCTLRPTFVEAPAVCLLGCLLMAPCVWASEGAAWVSVFRTRGAPGPVVPKPWRDLALILQLSHRQGHSSKYISNLTLSFYLVGRGTKRLTLPVPLHFARAVIDSRVAG